MAITEHAEHEMGSEQESEGESSGDESYDYGFARGVCQLVLFLFGEGTSTKHSLLSLAMIKSKGVGDCT